MNAQSGLGEGGNETSKHGDGYSKSGHDSRSGTVQYEGHDKQHEQSGECYESADSAGVSQSAGDGLAQVIVTMHLIICEHEAKRRNLNDRTERRQIFGSACFDADRRQLHQSSAGDAISVDDGKPAGRLRSEERRVGKECSQQCRSRWSPYH